MSATNFKRTPSIDPQDRRDERQIAVMATQVKDQRMLNELLAGTTWPERLAMIERLLPHLPFVPEEIHQAKAIDAVSTADCEYCGLRRGKAIPHACEGAIAPAETAN